MMAVGDQELQVVEDQSHGRVDDLPEPDAVESNVGLGMRRLERRRVVEQEDRLELGLRRPQEAQAALLRAGVRPLVRQDDSLVVALEVQRADEARARARDAVRADVVLLDDPEGGLLLDEHALVEPAVELGGRLLLRSGQRQPDDIPLAAGEVLVALRVREHVVGWRDQIRQGQGRRVAKRTELANLGHAAEPTDELLHSAA